MNNNIHGFTLIEVVVVIIVAGILAAVAMKSLKPVTEAARTEQTKDEMQRLSFAIVGNPELNNSGVRTDFGYVGDVGSLPANLDALVTSPGYSTWNGPYISSRFAQAAGDYKQDAWGTAYTYAGVNITSSGSGSNIVRKVANSTTDLLNNQVTGTVIDLNGTPPGPDFADSVTVQLVYPDGSGSLTSQTTTVNPSGFFSFTSIPIGNHDISAIYLPVADTMKRFVSVIPASAPNLTMKFDTAYFSAALGGGSSGSLIYVNGSANVGGGSCNELNFNIQNTSGSPITITTMTFTWTSPTAYFKELEFGGHGVFENSNPRAGSGQVITFSNPQTVNPGATASIKLEGFKQNPTGGPNVDMSNVDFTITFSDGSVITFNSGAC